MMNDFSLVISAPSGTGKTTIIRRLMKHEHSLAFSVSTTTRSKREGEKEGESYYYIDDKSFKKMIDSGDFVEWAKVHSHYYGTTKKELDRIRGGGKIPVFDVDVQGARNLRIAIPDAVLVFISPPSCGALADRLTKRNTEGKEELEIRLKNAVGELREYLLFDYVVVNDNIENAVDDVRSIVRSEMLRTSRMNCFVRKLLEESL